VLENLCLKILLKKKKSFAKTKFFQKFEFKKMEKISKFFLLGEEIYIAFDGLFNLKKIKDNKIKYNYNNVYYYQIDKTFFL